MPLTLVVPLARGRGIEVFARQCSKAFKTAVEY
jgi:hypothetical protein